MTAMPRLPRETPRPALPIRLRAAVIAGLRTACATSAEFIRRLDGDAPKPEDPTGRAFA